MAWNQTARRDDRQSSWRVGLFHCLIVSEDAARRAVFQQGALEGGWETIVCTNVGSARRVADRSLFQLAIVDMIAAGGQRPARFDLLVEQLAGLDNVLSIVCGNDANVQEEIWVRQMGAWLYLPGGISTDGMIAMCSEARQVAQRLHAPGESSLS